MFRGVAQLVARGVWDAEVASSSLVAPTIQGGEIKKIYFLYLTDADWKDFRDSGKLTIIMLRLFIWSFFVCKIKYIYTILQSVIT